MYKGPGKGMVRGIIQKEKKKNRKGRASVVFNQETNINHRLCNTCENCQEKLKLCSSCGGRNKKKHPRWWKWRGYTDPGSHEPPVPPGFRQCRSLAQQPKPRPRHPGPVRCSWSRARLSQSQNKVTCHWWLC
ncbi:uncharacterized protein LOC144318503 [Canis aureus]